MTDQNPTHHTVIVNREPSNGLGTAGFVTSLVAIVTCGLLSPIALILSLVGLFKKPKGFAIAGTVISGIQVIAILIIGVGPMVALVGIGVAAEKAQKEEFQNNRSELVETLRSTEDPNVIRDIESKWSLVADDEFDTLLEAAKERIPEGDMEPTDPTLEQDEDTELPAPDAVKRGFEEAERESDLKALDELRSQKTEYDKKLAALKGFQVLRANFSKEEDSIGMTKPVIELTIQNDTEHSVKRASFRGVLASPGRAIPWIDDTFNYEISGGVEPDEKTTWRLAPNMFSDWGKVEIRPDAKFTVTVTRLEGPDGEELFGEAHFGEHDEKRLAELEKKYKSEQDAAEQPATSPESK